MAQLTDWINDAEKYEFCKIYGVESLSTMEFVKRQEDFYITLLSCLNDTLNDYSNNNESESFKGDLMNLVKGLLVSFCE